MQNKATCDFSALLTELAKNNSLKTVVFSKLPKGDTLKIKGTLKTVSQNRVLQLEYFLTEGRVRQRNISFDCIGSEITKIFEAGSKQADIQSADGNAVIMISKKGEAKLISKIKSITKSADIADSGNNKDKKYIFSGEEDFMTYLGISDKNGRVHDKMQAKFRQINRFAEQVRDILKYLPENRTVHIADLCCGKSYLSFAVYHYFANILKRDIDMVCIDLKASVIEYCDSVAKKLDYGKMKFICGDINNYNPDDTVDLVISLHACDIATDIVLDYAASHRAGVILSTPCCQHELSTLVDCDAIEFVTKYPLLKQKICSTLTDGLRLKRLEAMGYKTDAIELTDPEDTPKNVLIRGILKKGGNTTKEYSQKSLAEYEKAYRFLTGKEPKPLPNYTVK